MVKTKVIISAISIIIVLLIGIMSFFIPSNISDMITGKTTVTRAFIHESLPTNCTVELKQGINMVSFPCETGERGFKEALSDKNGTQLTFNSVFFFRAEDRETPWRSYNPKLPNWTTQHKPNSIDRTRGYFIYMEESGTYEAEGLQFPISNIQLREGWNLVGYPSNTTLNTEDAIDSIKNVFASIHTYKEGEWMHYKNNTEGDLTHIEPGRAYWIRVKEDAVWRINW